MTLRNTSTCPVCDSTESIPLLSLEKVPILCNALYASPEVAKNAPVHDIELYCCRRCTHIHNTRFEPDLITYRYGYDNSLFYSPRYRSYAAQQAHRLIDTYALQGKRVIDIGCGDGEFLRLLYRTGKCSCTGYDPALGSDTIPTSSQTGIRLIADTYPEIYSEHADLYISRHVLEHLGEPTVFLQNIYNAMDKSDSVLFLEVPNGEHLLKTCSAWDIIYEHYSNFTPQSLLYLLARTGFYVSWLQSVFEGQYLAVDSKAASESRKSSSLHYDKKKAEKLLIAAEKFARNCSEKMEQIKNMVEKEQQTGKRMVVWGAGSKGITFLNQMRYLAGIAYVVDINPQKQGKYVPGTGQLVISPDFLAAHKPDTIFIANEIYRDEIIKTVTQLNISPQFVSI
ncbi:MAG: class I SAM-dependent methyltransferase [Desulfobulbaceae bacterium]|nr:class I SAM-dependent methyltransferase [Desulfobulbaceae bacterium]